MKVPKDCMDWIFHIKYNMEHFYSDAVESVKAYLNNIIYDINYINTKITLEIISADLSFSFEILYFFQGKMHPKPKLSRLWDNADSQLRDVLLHISHAMRRYNFMMPLPYYGEIRFDCLGGGSF